MNNHFLATIPFKPWYKIVDGFGIMNSSSAKAYVLIEISLLSQRLEIKGPWWIRDWNSGALPQTIGQLRLCFAKTLFAFIMQNWGEFAAKIARYLMINEIISIGD